MSMVWEIARKEFKETFRDGRFVWAGGILALLLIASLITGWSGYREVSAMRESAAAETRAQWLSQGTKNPHSAQHYGMYAFRPSTPLSLLDPGVNNYTGTLTLLSAHRPNEFIYKPAQDATALQRFGELSAAMILQLLFPLLIILLLFGAFAGEREEGTLRQLLSLGVPNSILCAGKGLGAIMALGMILVPSVLVSAGVILALAGPAADIHVMDDIGLRVLTLIATYLIYFSCVVMLTLGVSALAPSSRVALTAMLGFWILTGLVVPRVASDLSRQLYKTPSAYEFAAAVGDEKAKGPNTFSPDNPNHKKWRAEVLAKYKVDSIEKLPINFEGLALQVDEEDTAKIHASLNKRVWDQFDRQGRVQQALAIVSPYLAVRSISSAASASDFEAQRGFMVAAEQYRLLIAKKMNEDIQRGAAGKSNYYADFAYEAGPSLWAQVPPFDYDFPPMSASIGKQTSAIAMLLVWLLGSALFLRFAIRRIRADS